MNMAQVPKDGHMTKNDTTSKTAKNISSQPRLHQRAAEIQAYGTVNHLLPLELEEPVRLEVTAQLNQLLADTMTLRDLYKKSHWQVAGPTFYHLHLLFDKHFNEQVELVDSIAERIQLFGGVSIAMAADVAETTQIERHLGAARKSRCRSRDCWTHTRSSFAKAVSSRVAPPSSATTARMTWSSAKCCASMNCRCGS